MAAADGGIALDLVAKGVIRPDLILADYNLPDGMTGIGIARGVREQLGLEVPAIILTGDISTGTLRDFALPRSVQLHKPVPLENLARSIQDLLAAAEAPAQSGGEQTRRDQPP